MSLVKAILAVKRPQTDDTTDRLTAVCVCLAGQDRSDICHSVLVVAAATLAEFASVMAVWRVGVTRVELFALIRQVSVATAVNYLQQRMEQNDS